MINITIRFYGIMVLWYYGFSVHVSDKFKSGFIKLYTERIRAIGGLVEIYIRVINSLIHLDGIYVIIGTT